MFPTPVGSATGGVQPSTPIEKVKETEEFTAPQSAQAEKPQPEGQGLPPVPGSSGAPISLEAVTALQQVQDTTSANARQETAATTPKTRDTDYQAARQAAEEPAREAAELASAENRYEARTEVPAGEDTDAAGRSARNPLNLQI